MAVHQVYHSDRYMYAWMCIRDTPQLIYAWREYLYTVDWETFAVK